MRLIEGLNQGSPEWYAYRNKHLMATDSSVILQMNPWRTQLQLWNEKVTGVSDVVETDNMRRGKELEEPARQYFMNMTGIEVNPTVIESASLPWAAASLDGLNDVQHTIVEIKVHRPEIYSKTLSGYIPEYFQPQFQKQLFVSELDWLYYFPFDGTHGHAVKIYRDNDFIKKMIEEEKEFWDRVCNLEAPEATEHDFVEINSDNFAALAKEYIGLNSSISSLQLKMGEIKEELIMRASNKNVKGGGLKIQKVIRKGNPKYSSIPELKVIDLDQYRGDPVSYWKISEC